MITNCKIAFAILMGTVWICLGANPDRQFSAPKLDEAAAALAEGDFDSAARRFGELAADPATPGIVRGLALMGLAQTATARQDAPGAEAAWRRIIQDRSLPDWQRTIAQRRFDEAERAGKGLPARDPEAYRTRLPELPKPGVVFHVGSDGDDSGDGSQAKPFASLAKARDAVRAIKRANAGSLPKGGAQIAIRAGVFQLDEPLTLTAEDSGTPEAPVVFQAQPAGAVVLEGGRTVRGWRPVSDSGVLSKLDPGIRARVLEASLKENKIADWGDATDLKRRPELFVDGRPQTLARWPNDGFVHTGDILGQDKFKVWGSIEGCRDGKFRFVEDRAKRWVDEPDVRLYGYWFWDWYEEYQKVAAIDAEQGSFTLAKPYSSYGYRKGQRYFAVNVLRELDRPGEWYLDRQGGRIFWLPEDGIELARARIVLSVAAEPFITFENVRNVTLLGLTFQEARGDGIRIKGGADCLVAGCTLRRLGGDAIIVEGGNHHSIFGCRMHTLGCGAMRVNGGDRRTLSPGGHVVENCTVSDIARIKRTYAPAVHMDGCGNRIAHNRFERIPSSAMRIEGNDHLIELNQVRHVVQESDDQGGIDMFGNPLYRGVVIRWNRWSDITGGTECGAAGIRLDDMISGIVLHGNLFERCGAVLFGGVQIHGGKENVVDGNVFIDCHAGVSFTPWDKARWEKSTESFAEQAGREPYSTRYPALAHLKTEPNVNFISRNVLFGCKNVFLRDNGLNRSFLLVNSIEPTPEGLLAGDFQDPRLRRGLIDPIPMSEMGRYAHPWCASPGTGE
ncbi:MAG: right-handed parallel beta-helix repeat-containing protein [Verrucomicrobiia bacterium]